MQADKQLKVGIGDMKLTRGEGVLVTYALGSCIGLAFFDSYIKLGALLHIMYRRERTKMTRISLSMQTREFGKLYEKCLPSGW